MWLIIRVLRCTPVCLKRYYDTYNIYMSVVLPVKAQHKAFMKFRQEKAFQ